MKVLELAPLKDKRLSVLIVEKEYNEPFWILEPLSDSGKILHPLFRPSIAFHRFLENLTKELEQDFVTEELGMRSQDECYEDSFLAQMLRENNIPFFPVDIDANAKMHLATVLEKRKELRDSILKALAKFSKQENKESVERDYLVAYGQSLQLELEEQYREVAFPLREQWIVMGILDHAREFDTKKELTCVHLCSPEHVNGVEKLLESLDVRVETIRLTKRIISSQVEAPSSDDPVSLLQSMQIQVKPVVKKASDDAPYLLLYLDTDEKASPFDICMAYDAGYHAVVPYDNVTPEDAKRIVQDALFSRGPKGVKHTCFFIGGKNAEKAEEILDAAKRAMFSPFKASIIVDPGGAYTTATAMVAKVEHVLPARKLGELKDKTCAVLGTGSVGQTVAVLLAKLGCNVVIASISPKRTDGEEYAQGISRSLANKYGVKIKGAFAPTASQKLKILKEVGVVFCVGTRGVRVLDRALLKELGRVRVVVDANAVLPFGVEGLELKDDMKEVMPGVFGIGALTVGDLKYRLEREILREARVYSEKIYDYNEALLLARKLLQKDVLLSKLSLTLSDQPPKPESN